MSAWPRRFSVMTYNLWNEARIDVREPAIRSFFERHRPDILGVQELRESTRYWSCTSEKYVPRRSSMWTYPKGCQRSDEIL